MDNLSPRKRLWEVDFLRFIAIGMMVTYHILFFLWYIKKYEINVTSGFWRTFAVVDAALFMTLVGVSLYLRTQRKVTQYKDILKRAGVVFLCALIITLLTGIYSYENIVIFGVLHFVAIALVVCFLFTRQPRVAGILAMVIIFFNRFVEPMRIDNYSLVWLGIRPYNFNTFDYFPLIPWLGAVLGGIFIASILYPQGQRRFRFPEWGDNKVIKAITYLGRNSLWIYLIHFPIIVLLLTFL